MAKKRLQKKREATSSVYKKRTLPRCWRRNPADPVQEEMAEAALCKMGTENPSAEK